MSDCKVCPDKPGQGWKASGVTHCRECHTTWALGTKYTHCVTCHETFSTDGNCQRHQSPTKEHPHFGCRTPESVGLVCSRRSVGDHVFFVWQMPGQDEQS